VTGVLGSTLQVAQFTEVTAPNIQFTKLFIKDSKIIALTSKPFWVWSKFNCSFWRDLRIRLGGDILLQESKVALVRLVQCKISSECWLPWQPVNLREGHRRAGLWSKSSHSTAISPWRVLQLLLSTSKLHSFQLAIQSTSLAIGQEGWKGKCKG